MKTIPLTLGRVALVDDGDFDRVSLLNWRAKHDRGRWYAVNEVARKIDGRNRVVSRVWMHRMIAGVTSPFQVDHRDCNGLNNQSANLRRATHSTNQMNIPGIRNKYGLKGVRFVKACKSRPFNARIKINGREKSLGYFSTSEEAGAAYDRAATEIFGEFARTNASQISK